MVSNVKFSLRWNDIESNINGAFKAMREQRDFFDVTLACDDEQIQAHKVILSAYSPFFKTIFRRNPHQHPLLYLHGVSYTDLQSVLNFIYDGEVSVAQEDLNSFLALAENLKVKGLNQETNSEEKQPRQQQSILWNRMARPAPKGHAPVQEKNIPHPKPAQANLTSSRFINAPAIEDEIQEIIPTKSEPTEFLQPTHTAPSEQPLNNHNQQTNILATADDETLDYTEDTDDDFEDYKDQYMADAPGFNTATGNVGIASGETFQDPSELLQFVEHDKSDISRRRHVRTKYKKKNIKSKAFVNSDSSDSEGGGGAAKMEIGVGRNYSRASSRASGSGSKSRSHSRSRSRSKLRYLLDSRSISGSRSRSSSSKSGSRTRSGSRKSESDSRACSISGSAGSRARSGSAGSRARSGSTKSGELPPPNAGCFKCNKGCLVSCPVLTEGGTFRSTGSNNGRGYTIRKRVTCDSSYVVYLATCKECKSQYVGKSKAVFKKRQSNIKSEIQKNLGELGQHYGANGNGCGYQNLSVMIIEQVQEGDDRMLANRELYWKYQLRC